MKIKFIFSNRYRLDLFSTNIIYEKVTKNDLVDPNNFVISYTFNDLPLTNKFLELYPRYKKIQEDENNSIKYHFNYYSSPNPSLFLSARKDMNHTIDELIQFGYNIDESLRLELIDVTFLKDTELLKLNALHFFFETESRNLSSSKLSETEKDRIFHLLEKINNLVHFIETTPPMGEEERIRKAFEISIRSFSNTKDYFYELTDIDYKDFTFPNGGDLVADFSTVGKDLFACYVSNDIELIKQNEVKQQKYLTDYLYLIFNKFKSSAESENISKNKYYDWCKSNQLEKYLDYTQPKYNPARHVLASIDDKSLSTYENFYEKVMNKTPYLLGYVICREDGTLL